MPADRRCCPHCHCKGGHLRKIAFVAALGASACGGSSGKGKADAGPTHADLSQLDASVDMTYPAIDAAYGPPPVEGDGGSDGGF